jgi:hypothetical protein
MLIDDRILARLLDRIVARVKENLEPEAFLGRSVCRDRAGLMADLSLGERPAEVDGGATSWETA